MSALLFAFACTRPVDGPSPPPPVESDTDTDIDTDTDTDTDADTDTTPTATDEGTMFDWTVIHEIAIDLSDESANAINAEAQPLWICAPHEREYYTGTMTFDGVVFEGVGVRARGNGTADLLGEKPALKIDLEWDDPDVPGCPPERRLFGKRKLNLLNMLQDPSFVRVPMAGELDRLVGVPQPGTSYAHLTINGVDAGIVVNSENIDRQFLGDWYDSNDGMMYESGCFCDLVASNVPAVDGEDGDTCFTREFHDGGACDDPVPDPDRDPADWELLRDVVTQLEALPPGGFYPEVEAFFDFDGFLSLWAAQLFLGSGDGYFLNQNSYRIYHDPSTGLFSMIDHGSADGILRTFSDYCDADGLLALGGPADIFDRSALLTSRCLDEPDCKAAYAARMWEVVHEYEAFGLQRRADELHDFIIDDMHVDPRYYYSCNGVYVYDHADIDAHYVDYVTPWIDGRFEQVRAQLIGAGYPE